MWHLGKWKHENLRCGWISHVNSKDQASSLQRSWKLRDLCQKWSKGTVHGPFCYRIPFRKSPAKGCCIKTPFALGSFLLKSDGAELSVRILRMDSSSLPKGEHFSYPSGLGLPGKKPMKPPIGQQTKKPRAEDMHSSRDCAPGIKKRVAHVSQGAATGHHPGL